jgi:hypothetical protein
MSPDFTYKAQLGLAAKITNFSETVTVAQKIKKIPAFHCHL